MMLGKTTVAAAALIAVTSLWGPAQAQQSMAFDQAVFMTCTDVHAMEPEDRQSVAEMLAERSAMHHGVAWPLPDDLGDDAAILVRGVCTMDPQANLFSVIDRVIKATFLP